MGQVVVDAFLYLSVSAWRMAQGGPSTLSSWITWPKNIYPYSTNYKCCSYVHCSFSALSIRSSLYIRYSGHIEPTHSITVTITTNKLVSLQHEVRHSVLFFSLVALQPYLFVISIYIHTYTDTNITTLDYIDQGSRSIERPQGNFTQ